MAAISNINSNRDLIAPIGQDKPCVDNHEIAQEPRSKPTSMANFESSSTADMEQLAQNLAENLDQIGLGHKVAIRREEGTGRAIIEVRNQEGKLVNQFPPEKVLNLHRVLADLTGVVINRVT